MNSVMWRWVLSRKSKEYKQEDRKAGLKFGSVTDVTEQCDLWRLIDSEVIEKISTLFKKKYGCE